MSVCLSHPLNLIKSSYPSMTLGRRVLQNLIDLLTLFLKQQATTQQIQEIMANMIRPVIIHDMSPSEIQSSLSGNGKEKKLLLVICISHTLTPIPEIIFLIPSPLHINKLAKVNCGEGFF